MKIRRRGAALAGAGLTTLLCVTSATPAHAATPKSWESEALGLSSAHGTTRGDGIKVAVLDSGVEENHPALRGKVTTGPDYVQDGLQPGDPRWGEHGTAMASDVLKAAPKASILSVRVIDDKTKEESELRSGPSPISKGINYAVKHGADVISLSLGGESFGSRFEESETLAVAHAVHQGIPVIASAGNDGDVWNDSSYPAGYPGVISVAAVQQGGARAKFSTVRTYNAVAAPGVGIVSAKNTGGYSAVNGTSPAAALTAGVVALMLSANDKLTPAQVRSVLTSTANNPPGKWNPLVGYGPVNAAAAVRASAKPPSDLTVPVEYKGKQHLAAPDGTSKTDHPELETGELMVYLGIAGAGLLMVTGAILLRRAGRRRTAAALATGPGGPTGPVGPMGPGGPGGFAGPPR